MYYKQCKLIKGTTSQTAWIPEKFAVVGKFLKIKSDDGWQVMSIGGRLSEEYVKEHERNYLTQRRASDI